MTRYVNLLRLLMLLKPLARVKENAFIAEAIVLMITSAWQTPLLLFLMTAFWAVIGVQAYGGKIYAGNPELRGLAYVESSFDVLNLNDMPSGLFLFLAHLVPGTPQARRLPVKVAGAACSLACRTSPRRPASGVGHRGVRAAFDAPLPLVLLHCTAHRLQHLCRVDSQCLRRRLRAQ